MVKQLKDYLFLYIGQDCMTRFNFETTLRPHEINWQLLSCFDPQCSHTGLPYRFVEAKPILRPLSDISPEEADIIIDTKTFGGLQMPRRKMEFAIGICNRMNINGDYELFRYLLSCGFDIFNLISDGLAIDKTKL